MWCSFLSIVQIESKTLIDVCVYKNIFDARNSPQSYSERLVVSACKKKTKNHLKFIANHSVNCRMVLGGNQEKLQ